MLGACLAPAAEGARAEVVGAPVGPAVGRRGSNGPPKVQGGRLREAKARSLVTGQRRDPRPNPQEGRTEDTMPTQAFR